MPIASFCIVIFAQTVEFQMAESFYEKLLNNELYIPKPQSIGTSQRVLGYVFVGNEAFAMRQQLIKPYRQDVLTKERRMWVTYPCLQREGLYL